MADDVKDYSATEASNTLISGIDIDENCLPSNINNAIRAVMADIKNWTGEFEKGADIASATALPVNVAGMMHDVTGTTTITSLADPTNITSHLKILQFDGALTLTHSASLILPGAANITTTAGDVAVFFYQGSSVWTLASYEGANLSVSNDLTVGNDASITGGFTAGGELVYSGVIEPTQIGADQNNYAPTGVDAAAHIRVDSDATRTITGLSASQVEGTEITIFNDGANEIVLADESASSTAGNRFALPNSEDLSLGAESSATLSYDATASRWRVKGGAGGGAGGEKDAGGNVIGFANTQTTAGDYTLAATQNMMTAGTFTIASGDTITISSGARWIVV